ncbi:MAG: ABC transporter substrate-binding protein [Alphaproteobacteria bacterium]|nr:ABC transporter substrate-binding protein [Alphaproteobacteria bacterium]
MFFRRLLVSIAALVLSASAHAQTEKVSLAVLKLSSSGMVFIAKDKGYFAAEGLDVEFRFFAAAQPIAVAVTSGDADFGVTGLTAGFYNLAGKGALKMIAAQSRDEPGYRLNAYLVSPKAFEAGFDSLAKFPGKSLGITQVGSTFHYNIGRLAQKLGFDVASVRLVPLQSIPNVISALKGSQVDAVILPGTPAIPLVTSGDAKLLGWVGDETPWQLGALFASTKIVTERRATVEKFIRGYQKGTTAFAEAFPSRDAQGAAVPGKGYDEALAIIAKYTEQKPEVVSKGLAYVDPLGRLKVKDIYDQVAYWKSQKLVDADVDPKTFLDLGFVQGHFDQ